MICSQYAGSSDAGRMLYGIQSGNLVVRVNGTVVELETGSALLIILHGIILLGVGMELLIVFS